MMVQPNLRTHDLARAVGISVQQVRNYEAAGFIPLAERSPSGYRRYTPRHMSALRAARQAIGAYGSERARAIMQALHRGDRDSALAEIDAHHADLARARANLEQVLAALRTLAVGTAKRDAPAERLRAGEAARRAGVRASALRFWEQQGLLHPQREPGNNYRVYDAQEIRRVQVVALLRQAHYPWDAIQVTLAELDAGRPGRAVAAVEERRAALAEMSWRALAAAAALHAYLNAAPDAEPDR